MLLEDLEEGVDVGLLGLLLGHALVLVPGLPLVLAGQVCSFEHVAHDVKGERGD